jgi:hypothetical protein
MPEETVKQARVRALVDDSAHDLSDEEPVDYWTFHSRRPIFG